MSWFSENLAEFLIIIGLALLVIEILILGFSTFILLFVGIAGIISGGLIYLGIIPETMLSALLSMGIITAVSALLLWKPLKSMQEDVEPADATNDLIGTRFTLTDDVSDTVHPEYKFSGIVWKLDSADTIAAGTEVEVTHTDVGRLTVKAVIT